MLCVKVLGGGGVGPASMSLKKKESRGPVLSACRSIPIFGWRSAMVMLPATAVGWRHGGGARNCRCGAVTFVVLCLFVV